MAQRIRRRPILAGIVAVLLVIVLLFGGRAAWRLGGRLLGSPPPPRQTDVSLIADWMSVPYIGRAYRVPEPELYRALGLEREGRRMKSLRDLAQETGRTSDETLQIVRETVRAWQEVHPRPPGAPAGRAPPGLEEPKPGETKPEAAKPSTEGAPSPQPPGEPPGAGEGEASSQSPLSIARGRGWGRGLPARSTIANAASRVPGEDARGRGLPSSQLRPASG